MKQLKYSEAQILSILRQAELEFWLLLSVFAQSARPAF